MMVNNASKQVFYPMCSMNVAFNRKLIGPAFMQGLMGDGQPWARYDDMFAGWASKLIGQYIALLCSLLAYSRYVSYQFTQTIALFSCIITSC